MQIIIPMSGFGERFRAAGYSVPKPLIEVEGKPIIAHVIDMFPGETNFFFICNQEHLDEQSFHMKEILQAYCPTGRVIGISPHKLGPIHAVFQIEALLNPDEQTVVSYCDFTCYWDWSHFKKFVNNNNCAGVIPAYKGFHPHTLGNTNYAYLRETNGLVTDIQEKKPYTDNRMEEYASSGTYYFRSAKLMLESFQEVLEKDLNVGGEYYVSLAYKSLIENNFPVTVYPLQHFMQWGTPEDLAEYVSWSNLFKKLLLPQDHATTPWGSLIIPMAGLGQRFAKEGYEIAKPLIPVFGTPMVVRAANDLPVSMSHVFVLRADMAGVEDVSEELQASFKDCIIKKIGSVTEGQACTALIGLDVLEESGKLVEPITIGACDNGVLFDKNLFKKIIEDPDIDVIVWGVRGYPNASRYPQMYGWVETDGDNRIKSVSVKEPLGNPKTTPIILGAFTFRHADDFRHSVQRLIKRDGRVNGEFYIDSCINDAIALGLRCQLLEVDHYLCWGTPNDLKTFEYWQSCFHKWRSHPYSLKEDKRIPQNQISELEKKYEALIPDFLGINYA